MSKFRKFELMAIVLLIVIAPILLQNSYGLYVLNTIGIYAIIVIALDLLIGITGLISLGHAMFFALGAYFTAFFTPHLSPVSSLLITLLIIALFAVVSAIPLLRLKGYILALGTLAVGIVVYTLIKGLSITGGPNGIGGISNFAIGNFQFTSDISYFFLIWGTLLFLFILLTNLSKSRIGRALKAIHSNEDIAMAFGIRTFAIKVSVYVFVAIIAGLAGIYFAHYVKFVSPDLTSLKTQLDIVVMIFLGGIGTIFGPILGTLIYKMIPEVTSFMHDYDLLFRGSLLLVILLFFPKGLYPGIQKLLIKMTGKIFTKAKKEKVRRGEIERDLKM